MTMAELEAGWATILASPRNKGRVELIVRRPGVGEREIVPEAEVDLSEGLVGDNWKARGSPRTADGSAHPDKQLNVMNSRVIALVARDQSRWPLAGDQFFLDLDLSVDHLPAGTQLALGSAIIEVTDQPHTGCRKFMARFGVDAMRFVNSPEGKRLRLRGLNARVVRAGVVRVGDLVRVLRARRRPQSRGPDPLGKKQPLPKGDGAA
jgi:MOSC domain-containing protein YiiM